MVKLVYLYTCQTMQPYTQNRYYSIENLREDIVTIRIEIIPCLLVWFYFIEHLTLYHVYYWHKLLSMYVSFRTYEG